VQQPSAEGDTIGLVVKLLWVNAVKITEQDEIAKIVKDIKENTKDTGGKSYNDQPTNIKNFLTVSFYYNNSEGNPEIVYLYENRNKTYAEQPYSGIWKIKKRTLVVLTKVLFYRIISNRQKE